MKGQRYTLVWFLNGVLSEYPGKIDVDRGYVLGADYKPVTVVVRAKSAPGTGGVIIDINSDGVSLFTTNPGLSNGLTKYVGHTFGETGQSRLTKGSVVTLDIDSVGTTIPGTNLTVQLELEEL